MAKSSIQVVRFRNLDVNQHLTIHKPLLHPKTNVYNAMLLYDEMPFIVETPYLKNPFGITEYQKGDDKEKIARSITLMSSGTYTDTQEVIGAFFQELKKIDELMVVYGEKYSELLFEKKMSVDEIRQIYEPGVRGKLDKNGVPYPDKISPKLVELEDGKRPKINVFKNSKVPIEIENWEDLKEVIVSGRSLRGIIQPRLYFMKNKFGIVYEYHQIKLPSVVTKSEMKMGMYSFSE
jgi:hypothetical protein